MIDEAFWKGKRVLLTGATGFLGGWLARRLLSLDTELYCIVRQPKAISQFFLESFQQRSTVIEGSVADRTLIEGIFEKQPFDIVFHTAYGADVNRVLEEPLECFLSSALSTWLILESLRSHQPNCLAVISSTDKVYGIQEIPYRESERLNPLHPYEVAKASQDLAAQSYGKVFGIPVAVTRCGNYFGPYDFNFTRLMPGILQQIIAGEAPILRSNGQFIRDYLYIADAVEVQLLLAERLSSDATIFGEPFNFSYGDEWTVIQIVEKLLKLCGSSQTPQILDQVKVEIPRLHLDSSKARERLGWSPRIGFERGLEETVRWYQDYFRSE